MRQSASATTAEERARLPRFPLGLISSKGRDEEHAISRRPRNQTWRQSPATMIYRASQREQRADPAGKWRNSVTTAKGKQNASETTTKKEKNNSIGYRPPGDALAAVRVHRCVSAWLRNSLMAVYTQRERIWKVGPSVFDYLDGGKLCAERERETNVKAFTCQRNNSILSLSLCVRFQVETLDRTVESSSLCVVPSPSFLLFFVFFSPLYSCAIFFLPRRGAFTVMTIDEAFALLSYRREQKNAAKNFCSSTKSERKKKKLLVIGVWWLSDMAVCLLLLSLAFNRSRGLSSVFLTR